MKKIKYSGTHYCLPCDYGLDDLTELKTILWGNYRKEIDKNKNKFIDKFCKENPQYSFDDVYDSVTAYYNRRVFQFPNKIMAHLRGLSREQSNILICCPVYNGVSNLFCLASYVYSCDIKRLIVELPSELPKDKNLVAKFIFNFSQKRKDDISKLSDFEFFYFEYHKFLLEGGKEYAN